MARHLHRVVIRAIHEGMPSAVKESLLIPIFKKGDATDPNNYRGIQLISILRKVIAMVLARDLSCILEPGLLEYQCGFRPQRSCIDQLFALRKLSEQSVEWQQRLYVAFVDLRKAFDSVPRPALWAVLRERGVPAALLSAIVDMHTDTVSRVRVGADRGEPICIEHGVQQGCPLASVLFNAFFDHVVREALAACPDSGVTARRRASMGADISSPSMQRWRELSTMGVPALMFADDLAALAPTAAALQAFLTALESACSRWGLLISTDKTEVMLIGAAAATACELCSRLDGAGSMVLCDACDRGWHIGCLDPPLTSIPQHDWFCHSCASANAANNDALRPGMLVSGTRLQWVDKFKYLGSIFHETSNLDCELNRRIQLAAAAFRALEKPFFRQRCIPLRTRSLVYTIMVASVLLYGCEAWAITLEQLHRMEVFHRCRLRMMLGIRLSNRVSNSALYRRCYSSPLQDMIDRRQLRWLGHLCRMPDDRLAKQALYCTLIAPGHTRRCAPPPHP